MGKPEKMGRYSSNPVRSALQRELQGMDRSTLAVRAIIRGHFALPHAGVAMRLT
jgi:hypothetical protein